MKTRPLWQIALLGLLAGSTSRQLGLFESLIPALNVPVPPHYFLYGLVSVLLLLPILHHRRGVSWAGTILHGPMASTPQSGGQGPERVWGPAAGGLIFLCSMLALLEFKQPFYFAQDDNLVQFMPVMLQGVHNALSGVFPNWNPYQLLGAPTAGLGVYGLTYPPTYISYAVARYLLGNEYLLIDVFCWLHLAAGYLAMYWAARCYGVRRSLAALAALCVVLSGFALIGSRCWYYMSPVFTYTPLMIVAIAKLQQGRIGLRWALGLGAVVGLFFHAGNVQMWAYALLFAAVAATILLTTRALSVRSILLLGSSLLLGIAIAAPLLIVQLRWTANVSRPTDLWLGRIYGTLIPWFVPGSWVHLYKTSDWVDPASAFSAQFVYSGTVFCVMALLGLALWIAYCWDRRAVAHNVWLLCSLLALILMLGRPGLLWPLLVYTPLFDKFRLPLKFLAFFNIFTALGGAILWERILARVERPRRWEIALVTATGALLVAHCWMCGDAFYFYDLHPYQKLDAKVQKVLNPSGTPQYRFASIAQLRSPSAAYGRSLPQDLPTVYGIPSLLGYDPLVSENPRVLRAGRMLRDRPLLALREYGVRYAVVQRHRVFGPHVGAWALEKLYTAHEDVVWAALPAGRLVYQDEDIRILEFPDARPLAFAEPASTRPLAVAFDGDGATIDTSTLPQGGRVVLNMLWYPGAESRADTGRLPVYPDGWGRVLVPVPSGTTRVRIRISSGWDKGLLLGFLLLAVAAGLIAWMYRQGWLDRTDVVAPAVAVSSPVPVQQG